jgi:hypothetical protein
MAFVAEDSRFPLHGSHDFLPQFLPVPAVFQLIHVVDLKVPISASAVFTAVCIEPLY